MEYTKISTTTFEELQLNAGILLDSFDISTKEEGNLLGATSGGVNFKATPTFNDFGSDIDNAPKNTKELKKVDSWDVNLSGTFVSLTKESAKRLVAAGDLSANKITPRNELETGDFTDIWWIGDYGEGNGDFVAIHILNALSTGGFQLQSTDKGKGKMSFEFTGHYSMAEQDKVPFEIYIVKG